MKMYKKSQTIFNPVILELESQQEVDAMWHLTNCAFDRSLSDYTFRSDITERSILSEVKIGLWRKLNDVASPRLSMVVRSDSCQNVCTMPGQFQQMEEEEIK